jgi:hypothetical protein
MSAPAHSPTSTLQLNSLQHRRVSVLTEHRQALSTTAIRASLTACKPRLALRLLAELWLHAVSFRAGKCCSNAPMRLLECSGALPRTATRSPHHTHSTNHTKVIHRIVVASVLASGVN